MNKPRSFADLLARLKACPPAQVRKITDEQQKTMCDEWEKGLDAAEIAWMRVKNLSEQEKKERTERWLNEPLAAVSYKIPEEDLLTSQGQFFLSRPTEMNYTETFFERVKKLALKPEDVLVINMKEPWSVEQINKFKAEMVGLGYNNNLIFLGSGEDVSSLDEEEMSKFGWVRKRDTRREFF